MVGADTSVTGNGCPARIEATLDRCRRDVADGLLCIRHDRVARNRFAKAAAGQRRATYADHTQNVTVTVADLADIVTSAPHHHGVTVRLRSATIAHFELAGISRQQGRGIVLRIGHCLSNSRYSGGVYPQLEGERLVDVGTTAWAPAGLAEALQSRSVRPGDWADTMLSDLAKTR